MENEKPVIEQVKQGNRQAFNRLFNRYYRPLIGYASMFLPAEEADDVVQEVFLNVWLHRERLDESQSIRGYLLRSVYNTSLNTLKRGNRSVHYSSVSEMELQQLRHDFFDPDRCEVLQSLYNSDIRKDIEQAIDRLPQRCREVFILSYLEGVASKEISHRLGISLSTVDNHIYAALKQLREMLKQYRNISPVWLLLACELFFYCCRIGSL